MNRTTGKRFWLPLLGNRLEIATPFLLTLLGNGFEEVLPHELDRLIILCRSN